MFACIFLNDFSPSSLVTLSYFLFVFHPPNVGGKPCPNVTRTKGGDVDGRRNARPAGRSLRVEKVEGDEAPDLTALTHLGRFLLCQLLAVVSSERTRSHIHILMDVHS